MAIAAQNKPIALLVHGWNDDPTLGWFGWLHDELVGLGYDVRAPRFAANVPHRLEVWKADLNRVTGDLDGRSIIVAHSLGCWLTLRMFEARESGEAVRGVYLVSGFYDAPRPEAKQYFEPEPLWDTIRPQAQQWTTIYSDDDQIVTPDRTRRLAHHLGARIECIPGHGHFLGSRGMNAFPELLDLM